jgi:hypothetical protein
VSVHPSGRFVFVANYNGGTVAVFPVAADGALGDASDVRPAWARATMNTPSMIRRVSLRLAITTVHIRTWSHPTLPANS